MYFKNVNIKTRTDLFFSKLKGKFANYFTDKIYLSFGENCLADHILNRQGIKSFTTPFAHGRSNIEYVLQLEEDSYKDFLNLEFLAYEKLGKKEVPRLKKYNLVHNNYDESHSCGFEFTHHDIIRNDAVREKILSRVQKLQNMKGSRRFIILYYHKVTETSDMDMLLNDLCKLKEIYSTDKLESEVVCFYQKIVFDHHDRSLQYCFRNNIHLFTFNTLTQWGGDNNDIFWAICDEDLISEMIGFMNRL